jgi:acetylornithine deacetylase
MHFDTPDVLWLLKKLVAFPSLSGQEGPIADFLEAFIRSAGLPLVRRDNNVLCWLGEGPDRLLLNSHLDVVPPSADHPFDPFEPVEQDAQLFGRGTVDAKASGAAMLCALLELHARNWQPRQAQVMLALTTCEETGGGYNGLEDLRPHLPPLNAAVVGEPTSLQPSVAQKGLLILNVQAHGRSAHAARPHLGDNAIVRAARDIERLSTLTFERDDPFLGRPTLTVTTIQGGTTRNVVPDRCTFTLDIRSTPAYSHEELTELVAEAVESAVQIHSARFIPVATDVSERIVRASRAATAGAEPFGSPTASDWIFLHDVPTVKLGPGDSERSHTAGERISIAELRRAVRVYTDLIEHYYRLA